MALLGAGVYGLTNASSGISVSGAAVNGSALRAELSAIASTPTLQCYLSALNSANFSQGAGGATMSASGAAAWMTMRVEGLAIGQYVREHFHYVATTKDLALAASSLEGEMTSAASQSQLSCPGTSAQALAAMPAEMRQAQLYAQAASLFLLSKLNSTIPLTAASMKTYYDQHTSSYDTICVSIALVDPAKIAAFTKAQAGGASVSALAKSFSLDPSAAKGGAYGCYGPTSSAYDSVRADVGSTPLNTFPTTPLSVSSNGVTYALFVAPTKRTTTPFTQAQAAVVADLQRLNATKANTVKENILYRAAVEIDPALGRWGLSSSGPSVFALATPPSAQVNSPSVLTRPSASSYK